MKLSKRAIGQILVAGGLLAGTNAAMAQASVSGNVTMATDYVFRYISQTNEEPAIQGGFDVDTGMGIYVGTWASNVDFGDDATIEIDLYGGYAKEWDNGWGFDVGAIYYKYFDDQANDSITEIYGGASWRFLSATLYYSIDNGLGVGGDTDNYMWLEGAVEYPVGPVNLAGTIGRFESDDFDDKYTGWSLGASVDYFGLTWDLTWYDTDSDGEALFGDVAKDRVVFSLSKSL
jgi:uncharacterized protein (TIGR02001 family)